MKILTKSDKFNEEYCCSIVRIGEVIPIENSDFLGQTKVNGESIVVRKDQVREGDIFFYASNETQLNAGFLSKNNLFEWSAKELNDNYDAITQLVLENKKDEAKKKVGFFPKTCRVRMIKLRGVPSMGYLFGKEEISKFCPLVNNIDLEELVGEDFDTVNGELFVKAYIPYVPPRGNAYSRKSDRYREKKVNRFDRLVKGEFVFHYTTAPLAKCIAQINPDAVVTVSCKRHGSSSIISNIKVKYPKKLAPHKWMWNKFIDITGLLKKYRITDYYVDYGNVYSSRTVIKNQFINQSVIKNFYGTDIWGEYNELLKDFIPKGMTVYGEICGYITGSEKMVQEDYDYGCEVGKNCLMPYRITTSNDDGSKVEWNVLEVLQWTQQLITEHPDLKERIHPIDILYHGTLKDLYPEINVNAHWHENVLEAIRNDKKTFGLELREPFCKNNVIREGVVLRIDDDPLAEAFKLKSLKFLEREQKLIDEGKVDGEMAENLDTYVEP